MLDCNGKPPAFFTLTARLAAADLVLAWNSSRSWQGSSSVQQQSSPPFLSKNSVAIRLRHRDSIRWPAATMMVTSSGNVERSPVRLEVGSKGSNKALGSSSPRQQDGKARELQNFTAMVQLRQHSIALQGKATRPSGAPMAGKGSNKEGTFSFPWLELALAGVLSSYAGNWCTFRAVAGLRLMRLRPDWVVAKVASDIGGDFHATGR